MTNTRSNPALTKLNCRMAKELEAMTGIPAKDTYKEMIHAVVDEDFLLLIHQCVEGDGASLLNRPKKGREYGNCFPNAIAEEKETGNKACWGYLTSAIVGHAQQMVVHAFNKDKDGNYYDTANYPHGAQMETIVSVMADKLEMEELPCDYYYVKTKGRVFRWRSKWGAHYDDSTLEAEFERGVGTIKCRFLTS